MELQVLQVLLMQWRQRECRTFRRRLRLLGVPLHIVRKKSFVFP